MNIDNTKIINFRDMGGSSFTLKKDKSYNFSKFSKGYFFNKRFCFKIQNCVSSDEFTVEYYNKKLRDDDFDGVLYEYKKFNNM